MGEASPVISMCCSRCQRHRYSAAFPCLQDIASSIVARLLGLHPALINLDNGLILLPRFFKGHLRLLEDSKAGPGWSHKDAPLPQTALRLWHNLPGLCRQALQMLSDV